MANKFLTIDDAIEILQKAKEEHGNLPINMSIDLDMCEIDVDTWDVKCIQYDENNVTFYNY